MRTVLTPLAVLVLVALPSPQSTATAGRFQLRLADLVSDASSILVGAADKIASATPWPRNVTQRTAGADDPADHEHRNAVQHID